MLITGKRYRIGTKVYKVVIEESPDETCISQCDIEDCRQNKDFLQFCKDCNCISCLLLLGIGRVFKME